MRRADKDWVWKQIEDRADSLAKELERRSVAMRFLPHVERYIIGLCGYCKGPVFAGAEAAPQSLAERYSVTGPLSKENARPKCAVCGAVPVTLTMQERRPAQEVKP